MKDIKLQFDENVHRTVIFFFLIFKKPIAIFKNMI